MKTRVIQIGKTLVIEFEKQSDADYFYKSSKKNFELYDTLRRIGID